VNFLNQIKNKIINNKFSNSVKELFITDPLYMYSDKEDVYVYDITDGTLEDGRPYSDVSVTSIVNYAKNFRGLSLFKRRKLLEKANAILSGNEQPFSVRFRCIATVEAKIGTPEPSIHP
jgi:hypothetical protein